MAGPFPPARACWLGLRRLAAGENVLLTRLLVGHKRVRLDHPYFGKLTLQQGRRGAYWLRDEDDGIAIAIDSIDQQAPTPQQCAFYERCVTDLDATFAQASPLLIPEYEKVMGRAFTGRWRQAFALCGVGIPLRGDEREPWDLAFECLTEDSGFVFTCYFVDGYASDISVDK